MRENPWLMAALLSSLACWSLHCGIATPAQTGSSNVDEVNEHGIGSFDEGQTTDDAVARRPSSAEDIAARKMILVAEGEFVMGWATGDSDEQPSHIVYLDGFYLDVFEVTVEQYKQCVRAGGCEEPIYAPGCNWDGFEGKNHPINCMNRRNALAYCSWVGLRLPTEAEWEKAARGTDGRTYPWGYELVGDEANFRGSSIMATEPVGNHPSGVSPYGMHDMGGNVWEWVSDWYSADYYQHSPRERPTGPSSGEYGVLRGGSWWFDELALPSANRISYHPLLTDVDIGFRCARDL